jgi:hydroxyacylglutathione hydrolase
MKKSNVQVIGRAAFDDNYIWVLRSNGYAVVVDPGDAAPVLAHLAATGDRLAAILLTHHHGDHVGGVGELIKSCAAPPMVFGPAAENIEGVSQPLQGSEQISLESLDLKLEVLAVPGHTRGHLAYFGAGIGAEGAVFCGDTLFGAGCGRLFEGTPAQMHASLAKIAVLPAPTFVYCAHEYTQANLRFAIAVEPDNAATQTRRDEVASLRAKYQPTIPSSIGLELATNPFLRWDAPAVIQAAANRLGQQPHSATEVFAAIRQWRNDFK